MTPIYANLPSVLLTGSLVLAGGLVALALLVRQDLAPVGAMEGGGRWFLGAALGFGLVGIAIKLAIIVALASLPRKAFDVLIAAPSIETVAVESPEAAPTAATRVGWRALPDVAPAPFDNPTSPEKVALGRRLFLDPKLSLNGEIACASCHDLDHAAGADARPVAVGVFGQKGQRNAPSVYNAAFQARLFWDGRAATLEEQALGPLVNAIEMGMPNPEAAAALLRADAGYRRAFADAFGADKPITPLAIAQAIAAFERTLITPDAPYDRFVRGDKSALNAAQKRGMDLFGRLGCVQCHSGPNFSGASLLEPMRPYVMLMAAGSKAAERYNLALDKGKAAPDAKNGVWRIPSLRNVALTAPYFHNGSVDDLAEAVRLMAQIQLKAVIGAPAPAERATLLWSTSARAFERIENKVVSEQDVADLVAFLNALTSDSLARRMAR